MQIVNFKKTEDERILFVINGSVTGFELEGFDYLIHFDVPETKNEYLDRVEASIYKTNLPVSITFSTDTELPTVKKIELTTGKKMELAELPLGLIIEGTRKRESEKSETNPIFGFQETTEVWILMLGLFTFTTGIYYFQSSRFEQIEFYKATIIGRIFFFIATCIITLVFKQSILLAAIGSIDLMGALWTWRSLNPKK